MYINEIAPPCMVLGIPQLFASLAERRDFWSGEVQRVHTEVGMRQSGSATVCAIQRANEFVDKRVINVTYVIDPFRVKAKCVIISVWKQFRLQTHENAPPELVNWTV
ncbi:hypothetical protein D2Q93_09250 [Alicyclobacillaceae bacterium I2511]|jgi:hypothetical protein|nr:hypothetical protein D2Q93_09250 [Alicyclobacillaceae bacterium I2511]